VVLARVMPGAAVDEVSDAYGLVSGVEPLDLTKGACFS
jgi:hypothetical protein